MWGNMGYGGWDGWIWPMAAHGLMGLLWLVLLVAGIAILVRLLGGGSRRQDSAVAVLELRYANGEIDRDEFLARRKDLR